MTEDCYFPTAYCSLTLSGTLLLTYSSSLISRRLCIGKLQYISECWHDQDYDQIYLQPVPFCSAPVAEAERNMSYFKSKQSGRCTRATGLLRNNALLDTLLVCSPHSRVMEFAKGWIFNTINKILSLKQGKQSSALCLMDCISLSLVYEGFKGQPNFHSDVLLATMNTKTPQVPLALPHLLLWMVQLLISRNYRNRSLAFLLKITKQNNHSASSNVLPQQLLQTKHQKY